MQASSLRTVAAMADRPARGWRRKVPYERLVDLYTDTHTKLETALYECPSRDAKGDSEEVQLFLVKLAQANLRLRLLGVLCRYDVKDLVDGATEEVDKAVRAPVTTTVYEDPSAWLMCSIQAVDEAARRNVEVTL
jgi:hypothetical protein